MLASSLLLTLLAGSPPLDSYPDEDPTITERELAKARFELSRATVKDLQRRRLLALSKALRSSWAEYDIGKGTLGVLMEQERTYMHAQTPPALLPVTDDALEKAWRAHYVADRLSRQKYEAGTIKSTDVYTAQGALLEIEIQIALRAAKPKE